MTRPLTVGRVAELLEVSAASLRSWEIQGLIPVARRTPTNQRVWDESQVQQIREWLASRKN